MKLLLVFVVCVVTYCEGYPYASPVEATKPEAVPRQLLYLPRQEYHPEFQYNIGLIDPQFQQLPFNFEDKQPYPRIQPQLLLYPGGAQGQPFLLNPGSPPGNFLLPQPPPPPPPQRPLFVAGYPKPAHIPPIEKDAEEIPTNPDKIPPFPTTATRIDRPAKPQKLETFNEKDEEPGVVASGDKTPTINHKKGATNNLRPGQRFFILNGIPLFPNYPYQPYTNTNLNPKFGQGPIPVLTQQGPAYIPQGFSLTKPPGPPLSTRIENINNDFNDIIGYEPSSKYPQNLITLNHPEENFKPRSEVLFTSTLPLSVDNKENRQEKVQLRFSNKEFKLEPIQLFDPSVNDGHIKYFDYQAGNAAFHDDDDDDDAIVIEAKAEDETETTDSESESVTAPVKTPEPSMSQAQPGAIALAGPGGVAAAGPKGTALVGAKGLAVSSPQATAIAGPARDQLSHPGKEDKVKDDANNSNNNNKKNSAKKGEK